MTRATRFALALLGSRRRSARSASAHAEPPNAKAHARLRAHAVDRRLRRPGRRADAGPALACAAGPGLVAARDLRSRSTRSPSRSSARRSPTPACLQRIADQLKADHFVWGTLVKKGAAGEVNGGRAPVDARQGRRRTPTNSYSDNLKDASDESLRTIATRLFGKLTGAGAGGTLVVHAGTAAAPCWSTARTRGRSRAASRASTCPPGRTPSRCACRASTHRRSRPRHRVRRGRRARAHVRPRAERLPAEAGGGVALGLPAAQGRSSTGRSWSAAACSS